MYFFISLKQIKHNLFNYLDYGNVENVAFFCNVVYSCVNISATGYETDHRGSDTHAIDKDKSFT